MRALIQHWLVAVLLCAACYIAPPARAVLFVPLSLEALTSQADLVVQGHVLSKACQRDATGRIFTSIELEVVDVWKGAVPGSRFFIVQGGGVLGEEQSVVAGQVQYELNEEVVAFLVRNSRGEPVTLGLRQGKFHVWTDAATGVKLAASPFLGMGGTLGAGSTRLKTAAAATAALPAVSVAELKQRVLEVRP